MVAYYFDLDTDELSEYESLWFGEVVNADKQTATNNTAAHGSYQLDCDELDAYEQAFFNGEVDSDTLMEQRPLLRHISTYSYTFNFTTVGI